MASLCGPATGYASEEALLTQSIELGLNQYSLSGSVEHNTDAGSLFGADYKALWFYPRGREKGLPGKI